MTALRIRTNQPSITANFWPFTAHIHHVMIIVTSGFSKKSYLLEIPLSNLLSVNKLYMARLYFKLNICSQCSCLFVCFLNEYDVYKDKVFRISIKSSHINFLIIFVQFVLFYCCVLFNQTGNTVDGSVQRQHFTLIFICVYQT